VSLQGSCDSRSCGGNPGPFDGKFLQPTRKIGNSRRQALHSTGTIGTVIEAAGTLCNVLNFKYFGRSIIVPNETTLFVGTCTVGNGLVTLRYLLRSREIAHVAWD